MWYFDYIQIQYFIVVVDGIDGIDEGILYT